MAYMSNNTYTVWDGDSKDYQWTTGTIGVSEINTTVPTVGVPPVQVIPVLPDELAVCVVCGVEDVVVFCDACKEVIREARKRWAEDFLKEIEDGLS